MTLEELLKDSGTVEFRVRVLRAGENGVAAYIHPQDRDGGTIDFVVNGDHVTVIKKLGLLPKKEEPIDRVPFVAIDGDISLNQLLGIEEAA